MSDSSSNKKSKYFKNVSNDRKSVYFSQSMGPCEIFKAKKKLQEFKRSKWVPPLSPFGLIQESLYAEPWRLLVATIFLNKTNGRIALPLLENFFERYPTPKAVLDAETLELSSFLKPIGLNNTRGKIIKRFTQEFTSKSWMYPGELYGIGKYGDDSFRIFCMGEWRSVRPRDKKLNLYHSWLCQQVQAGILKL